MVFCNVIGEDEDLFQPVTSDETVAEGGTVTLTCRVAETDNSSLQWSNTAQQTLYFGAKRGERQKACLWREVHGWMSGQINARMYG